MGMDMSIPPIIRDEYVYRCTRCGSSNVPLDSVSASVDPRWVLGRCLDCSYTILRAYLIPSHEGEEDADPSA